VQTTRSVTDIVDVMESTVPTSPESFGDKTNELVMAFDLAVDESRRRAAMLHAIGAHWDPAVVLANEQAACEMLYSGLDGPTQQIYDYLVAARVIPRRQSGNDVAD
jgi:hypothetical protein